MSLLGNLIWLIFGGIFIFLEYLIASFILIISIVGIPFGFQTLKLSLLALWPFGKEIRENKQTDGCLSITMNVIWILIGGIWISLTHIIFGIILFITIIGIPFANQHFKLARLALAPFGKVVI